MGNYLIVKIKYVDYKNMKKNKIKVKYTFIKPQIDLSMPLIRCIKDFYAINSSCDIINIAITKKNEVKNNERSQKM